MPLCVSALRASPVNSGIQSNVFGNVALVHCKMSGFPVGALSFCQDANIAYGGHTPVCLLAEQQENAVGAKKEQGFCRCYAVNQVLQD